MLFRFFFMPLTMFGMFGQNRILPEKFLKEWPRAQWMKGQKKPALHQWLSKTRSKEEREQMKAIGNLVVPAMATLGMHSMYGMWH